MLHEFPFTDMYQWRRAFASNTCRPVFNIDRTRIIFKKNSTTLMVISWLTASLFIFSVYVLYTRLKWYYFPIALGPLIVFSPIESFDMRKIRKLIGFTFLGIGVAAAFNHNLWLTLLSLSACLAFLLYTVGNYFGNSLMLAKILNDDKFLLESWKHGKLGLRYKAGRILYSSSATLKVVPRDYVE